MEIVKPSYRERFPKGKWPHQPTWPLRLALGMIVGSVLLLLAVQIPGPRIYFLPVFVYWTPMAWALFPGDMRRPWRILAASFVFAVMSVARDLIAPWLSPFVFGAFWWVGWRGVYIKGQSFNWLE